MTLQTFTSRVRSFFSPNTSGRRHTNLAKQPPSLEPLEQRLLLTTIDYTDPSLPPGAQYGDQAEVEFTSATPQRSFSDGMSGPGRPAFFRTTGIGRPANNPNGILYNTYVLNWEDIKPGGGVPGTNLDDDPNSGRNIRVTIDETVPFNAAHGREVMRIINLPNQFSARWQRVNENGVRVDLDTENAGGDNQVGRDFEVRTDMTQQFRTVIRNGQGGIVRSIEWRRLTTSNLNGSLSGPSQLDTGDSGTLSFRLNNTGNRPYTHGGQVRYQISTSSQKPTFQQLLNAPNTVPLPNIGVGGNATRTDSVSFNTPGTYYIHWVIDTDEAPDWRYSAPNGPGTGSGASVLERDSFANKNFPVVPDNNATNSLAIVVNSVKTKPVVNPPGATSVNEGTSVSLPFTAFDPDGGPVIGVAASLGSTAGSSPNFVWNYDAVDDLGPISVALTATDDEGMSTTASFPFTVNNVAPSFTSISSASIEENRIATITGAFTDPGVLDTHTLLVNWGDGITSPATVDAATRTFTASHLYSDDDPSGTTVDTYAVSLTLTDDDGDSTIGNTSITVTNVAPQIDDFQISETRFEGTEVIVTSAASDQSPNDILTYNYSVLKDGVAFASGSGIDQREFRFTPDDNGVYRITLTVSDDDTGADSVSADIVVDNIGPVIDLGADMIVNEGDSLTLDLTKITDPGDDTVFEIRIDWGDGSPIETVAGPGLYSHVYADGPDMHQIAVTLVDEDGEWSGTGPSVSGYLNALGNTPSLLSRYELDGNVDDTLALRDGVISGGPGFVPGLVGSAIEASNGNYGHVLPGTSYVPGNDSFSASMHFLLEQPSAPLSWAPLLVMQQSDFSEGFLLQLGTTNVPGDTLNLGLHGGPKNSPDNQLLQYVFPESQLGQWHQAGFTVDRDNGTASLYFDGELLVTETLVVSSLDPTKGMFIGQYDFTFGRNGHPRFVGGDSMLLDEVLLFDTALSAEQIEGLSLIGGSPFTKKVTVLNVDPTAVDDAFDVMEDDGVLPLDVLANDTDPAGLLDPLEVISIDTTGTAGLVTFSASGVSYSPNGQFESLAVGQTATDTFSYTISDGDGGTSTASVTVTINGENDAPTANPDFATTTENQSVTVDVIANDTDPDIGDVLSLVANTSLSDATADFSLAQNPNGVWSYYNADDTVRDGNYQLMAETAQLEVPGGPVVWHADTTPTAIRPFVGINDVSIPGLGTWQNGELAIHPGRSQRAAGAGLVVLTYTAEADGLADINYDLAMGLNGNVLWFLELNDGSNTLASGSMVGSSGTASIDLDAVPVAAGDRINLVIDSNGSVGSDLVRVLRGEIALSLPTTFSMTLDSDGSTIPVGDATIVQNGNSLTFDPGTDLDFLAAGETATVVANYTVADNHGATDTSTLTISVVGTNDAPVANPDSNVTTENEAVTTDVIANDTDPDATDILSLVAGASIVSMTLDIDSSAIALGDAMLSQNGNEITFDPGTDFDFLATGETATVEIDYTVTDDAVPPLTDNGRLTITVIGTNDAPVAQNIAAVASEDGPGIVLTADFSDPDATDTHTFGIDTTGTVGAVINNGDGTFGYDPNGQFESLAAGETATDTFQYSVDDGFGGVSVVIATVTILGQNDAPIAVDITGTADEDGPAITLIADFTDVDISDTHTFAVDTTGTAGTVANNGDGTFSYDPNGQFEYLAVGETAIDTFTWTVTDNNGAASQATALVTITGSNDAPVLTISSSNPTVDVKSDDGHVSLSGSFSDVDLSEVHEAVIDWGDGTTTLADIDQVADTLAADHLYEDGGIYAITVTLTDGNGGTATQTTQAVVTGVGLVDGVLYVIGTDAADHVRIRTKHGRLTVRARLDGQHQSATYAVSDVTKIVAITCDGSDHIDVLTPSHIPVHVEGGDGRDHIFTAGGDDYIDGGKGRDHICSFGGNDVILAGAGADIVWAGSGDDYVDGGAGRDTIFGEDGDDTIYGRSGMDDIHGGRGADIIFGGAGADWLSGDDGNDFIDGGKGDDFIKGGHGDDVLIGGRGRDSIHGGHGNDVLIGGRLSIDWEQESDLSGIDRAMMAWAAGDLAGTLDALGTLIDDDQTDWLHGGRGHDRLFRGRGDR
ncbi:MAG: Ig-like domain-containing protein [Planctomycetaceae bacterium]|nr:Ig-like domain-containing protein [Planctomycetaceae bacterium]